MSGRHGRVVTPVDGASVEVVGLVVDGMVAVDVVVAAGSWSYDVRHKLLHRIGHSRVTYNITAAAPVLQSAFVNDAVHALFLSGRHLMVVAVVAAGSWLYDVRQRLLHRIGHSRVTYNMAAAAPVLQSAFVNDVVHTSFLSGRHDRVVTVVVDVTVVAVVMVVVSPRDAMQIPVQSTGQICARMGFARQLAVVYVEPHFVLTSGRHTVVVVVVVAVVVDVSVVAVAVSVVVVVNVAVVNVAVVVVAVAVVVVAVAVVVVLVVVAVDVVAVVGIVVIALVVVVVLVVVIVGQRPSPGWQSGTSSWTGHRAPAPVVLRVMIIILFEPVSH